MGIKILKIFCLKSHGKAQMRYVHVVANSHADYKGKLIILQIFCSRTSYFYLYFPVLPLLFSAEAVLFSFK